MPHFLTLSRMEILGFKSFYGRTRFEFPEGITAVVGPNGCGKSNIGDAISWVLGEQKASSLRSDRMEDVIFNGSEGRRPLGMAEVSLHFRNLGLRRAGGNGHGGNGHGPAGVDPGGAPDGSGQAAEAGPPIEATVPIPAASDAPAAPGPGARFFLEDLPEEVVVTRRLYRSGESEYILNGERCRLRDIQDLLVATQVGSRLYSTIEQGKIDQILAAKPKDRRAMFEEAAGILGYKTRRRQAEMKLEAAQANLLRISDITSEVDKQINALRRQAAKARRYRRLQDLLRERRAAIARRRLSAVDEDRRRTLDAIGSLKAREAAAAAALAAAESDLERLRQKLEEGEEEARRRREAIHALDLEIDRLKERRRSGAEQARDLESRAAAAAPEIDELLRRAAAQEGRCLALAAEIEAEAARLEESGRSLEGQDAAQLDRAGAIARAEAALENTRAAQLEAIDVLTDLGRRLAALEEQRLAAGAEVARLQAEEADARQDLQAAAGAIAELEARAEAEGARLRAGAVTRDTLAAEERLAAARLASLERLAEEMNGRAAALGERLAALEAGEGDDAGRGDGVGEILRGGAGFAPHGVVGERIQAPPGLERAVEAILGDRLEAVVVSDVGEAARGIAHLKATRRGRAAFSAGPPGGTSPEPLPDALARAPGVLGRLGDRVGGAAEAGGPVASLLARAVLVDGLDRAIALRPAWPGHAFVTPQGDIVHADGVVAGGDGPAVTRGIAARRREIEAIRGTLADLARERESRETEAAAARDARLGLLRRLEAAAAALLEDERSLVEGAVLLQQRRAEKERIERALPRIREARERLESANASRDAATRALAGEIAAAEGRRSAHQDAIREAARALASARAERERAQQALSEARAAVAAGRQRLLALTREREAIEDAVREARALADRRAAERREWSARAATIAAQDAEQQRAIEETQRTRAEAAAREESAQAGLAYDRSLVHAREASAREARTAHAALRDELQGRELHLARLDADLEHLARACREDLMTTLEALRDAPVPPDEGRSLEEDEQELERLRDEVTSLGPVNLMAIEQHTELQERYDFLSAQTRDLEDSIASLQDTIRRINRQSRERFRAAFEAIQDNFQRVFGMLFGGGTARLRLQEGEEDVLEAGIEIVAQPPGKRLQALSLLSGGERALTAVALLFSLFRYRPSPFCVLDEVDAPLDEANVGRFTDLLKALREETQFILITHNRRSMEAADLLYGVTMEEPGVSKVLPLRFE